jgi:hypothetical protein
MVILAAVSILLSLAGPTTAEPREFKDAKLTVADGDKSEEVDVTVRFSADKMQIVKGDGDKRVSLKDLPYAACKSAEYSYSKSPRWKSALLISPFLFMSSGKKHWLMVKTADDYALMHLDKGNYKLVLAELETRTGLTVQAEGESK